MAACLARRSTVHWAVGSACSRKSAPHNGIAKCRQPATAIGGQRFGVLSQAIDEQELRKTGEQACRYRPAALSLIGGVPYACLRPFGRRHGCGLHVQQPRQRLEERMEEKILAWPPTHASPARSRVCGPRAYTSVARSRICQSRMPVSPARSCASPLGTCTCFARSCAPPLGTCTCFARSCAPPLGTCTRFARSCASPLEARTRFASSRTHEPRTHGSPARSHASPLGTRASLTRSCIDESPMCRSVARS